MHSIVCLFEMNCRSLSSKNGSIVQTLKVRGETVLGSKMLLHTKIVHAKFHALIHSFRVQFVFSRDLYMIVT